MNRPNTFASASVFNSVINFYLNNDTPSNLVNE